MRSLAAFALLSVAVGTAQAQTVPDKSTAPLTQNQTDMRDAAEIQIQLLTKQVALLTQLVSQNQRGLVVYPVSMALPGPINCQGNCRATVADICRVAKYPNGFAYPATVPSDAVGSYANGICYGP